MQPSLFSRSEVPGHCEDEDVARCLHRNQGAVEVDDRNIQGGGGTNGRPAPREQVRDARSHGDGTRQQLPVQPELVVQRRQRRDGDEKRRGARTVQMDARGEKHRAHQDAPRIVTDDDDDPVDDGIEHTGVVHDAEIENGEHEHGCDRSDRGHALNGKTRGLQPVADQQRCQKRYADQRHQR